MYIYIYIYICVILCQESIMTRSHNLSIMCLYGNKPSVLFCSVITWVYGFEVCTTNTNNINDNNNNNNDNDNDNNNSKNNIETQFTYWFCFMEGL